MWLFVLLGFFAFIYCVIAFPMFRCIVFKPFTTLYHCGIDLFYYFYHHKFNYMDSYIGQMICFTGLFGKGKTLNMVHYAVSLYERYNNKIVFKDGKFKHQKVLILSNIALNGVPYIEFTNLKQLVTITDGIQDDNESYINVIVIFDELQNCLYCRNFKTNLSEDVLRILTQIRKLHASILYTSTRFSQTDCTIRQDTSYVIDCNKIWRFGLNTWYDAWDYENCMNPEFIKSVKRNCWFVRNKDYSLYDTCKLTDIISKDVTEGNVVEMIERNTENEVRVPRHLSKKGRQYYGLGKKKAN